MLFSGVFDLPLWGLVVVALVLTHITIAAVTIFLHRCQAHRALELHPLPSHFFRLWLWMTTGMLTKEWAAVHRKHHAKCETAEDPHSPQVYGINRVLWGGVFLYVREALKPETLERYGHGTPDDWMERNVYTRYTLSGITIMGLINVALFGIVPGVIILVTQVLWIPFWAAGVINGIGHFWGYRNFECEDASTNIIPLGILIGGEELHNNHHSFASSAKLSSKWYEFDIGWMYIRILESMGLATVKKVAPKPRFTDVKPVVDADMLHAVIANRYDVLAKYAKSLKATYVEELGNLKRFSPQDAQVVARLRRWLHIDESKLNGTDRNQLEAGLAKSKPLQTVYSMRQDLAAVWSRSSASKEQVLKQLQDWCHRAETSGIKQLEEFSQRLRCYA
jgi:stearoyl-CoA desaturase (delta-9 desaturase)